MMKVSLVVAFLGIFIANVAGEATTKKEAKPKAEWLYEGKNVEYWLAQLRDLSPDVLEKTHRALVRFGDKKDPRVIPGVLAVAQDQDADSASRGNALEIYILFEDPKKATPILIKLMNDMDHEILFVIVHHFDENVKKPDPNVARGLLGIVERLRNEPSIQEQAVRALSQCNDNDGKIVKQLIAIMANEKLTLESRLGIVEGIRAFGGRAKDALPMLRKLSETRDGASAVPRMDIEAYHIRVAADKAIEEIEKAKSTPQ